MEFAIFSSLGRPKEESSLQSWLDLTMLLVLNLQTTNKVSCSMYEKVWATHPPPSSLCCSDVSMKMREKSNLRHERMFSVEFFFFGVENVERSSKAFRVVGEKWKVFRGLKNIDFDSFCLLRSPRIIKKKVKKNSTLEKEKLQPQKHNNDSWSGLVDGAHMSENRSRLFSLLLRCYEAVKWTAFKSTSSRSGAQEADERRDWMQKNPQSLLAHITSHQRLFLVLGSLLLCC